MPRLLHEAVHTIVAVKSREETGALDLLMTKYIFLTNSKTIYALFIWWA